MSIYRIKWGKIVNRIYALLQNAALKIVCLKKHGLTQVKQP